MLTLSPAVILEFCDVCQWTYEVWVNHLELFDNNKYLAENRTSCVMDELGRLYKISHQYSLLQIVKLHDPNPASFGIRYVLKHGDWSDSVRRRLEKFAKELDGFASQLRSARNKIVSHHDLRTILAGAPLGEFAEGEDEKYFEALQEFVNTVHNEVIGGDWPFCNLVKNDVAALLARIRW